MGLLDNIGRTLFPTHNSTLDGLRLDNELKRRKLEMLSDRKRSMKGLQSLLGPSTAGPGIAAPPQLLDQRMRGLLMQAAPEEMATNMANSLFSSPKESRHAPAVREMEDRLGRPLSEQEIMQVYGAAPSGRSVVQEDKPIPPNVLANLVDRDGNPVNAPLGTLMSEAREKGWTVRTMAEGAEKRKKGSAAQLVTEFEPFLDLFPADSGTLNRVKETANSIGQQWSQDDPRYSEYASMQSAFLAPLAKALGESGALSDSDRASAGQSVPQIGFVNGGWLIDTRPVAQRKLDRLVRLYSQHAEKTGESVDEVVKKGSQLLQKQLSGMSDEELEKLAEGIK